ncbi:beta-lactamase/transpeptidase-like protein [Trichoderma sp. TUCIM 5745]
MNFHSPFFPRFIKSRLEALGPLITQICDITGIPGISLGVLHHGETLHTASYGFQDVERQVEPNADTSFLICSMTKAITASLIGMVIDEGKLNFSTQLHQIIPEFQRNDAQANITIEDLLSHRTGLAPYDGLWLGSDNQILMNRSEAIPILNYTPAASALRTEFIYNNIAYEALGQVLERSTGLAYSELLHKRIIEPLNLHRTFYAEEPLDNNTAKSYTTLKDGSFYEVPPWGHGKNLLIGAAGAIRSSISDLLVLYKALINDANSQVAQSSVSEARNVFKQMPQLLKGKIGIPNQSLREYSYASGWIRAQLPAIVDLFADYEPPLLGSGSASRLMIHHQGHVAGNVGYAALFPETTSAVVVLGNSAGLTDAMRLLGQVIVETVLGNEVDEKLYLDTAIAATKNTIASMDKIYEDLLAGKIIDQPMRNIAAYIGRYYNAIDNFFIDIIEADGKLRVAYMGSTANTFDLTPYEADSFFWWLDFDESAKRARLPGYPKDYFILKFGCPSTSSWLNRDVEMGCLTWKHEFQLAGPGEVFRKKTRESHIDISGIFGILKELR